MFTVVGPTYQLTDNGRDKRAGILWGVARLDAAGHHVWSRR
jgi:hypothetical protein